MSLGKLLSAGRSLVGLHGSTSRYELQKGALPKFESAKNPFAARPTVESDPELTPAEIAAATLKDTQRLPLLQTKPDATVPVKEPVKPPEPTPTPTPTPAPSPAPAAVPAPIDNWLKRLSPLVWWGKRKPVEPKPAIPRFNKAPVQGELSLDNIKVVRNDLNDADVEVAPAKPRPAIIPCASDELNGSAVSAAAAAMAIPELPPARNAWEFLGERLLGKH